MNNLSDILRRVLNNKHDFCCLCFKTIDEHPIHFEDDVVIYRNNISVADVLSCVLGDEVSNAMSTFEVICSTCMSLAASSYSFINTTKCNTVSLLNVLDQLHNCLDHTHDNQDDCKTLFVSLNPDLSYDMYYNNEKLLSNPAALKKFKNITKLMNPKKVMSNKPIFTIKTEIQAKINMKRVKKECTANKSSTSGFKTQDMLYDKNDRSILKCKECLKVFMNLSNLRNHYIRVHAPKDYKCTQCSRAFGSRPLMELHREESHTTIVCSECGKTFTNRHTLRMHEKSHYTRYVCPDCGRIYKNSNTYKQHIANDICQSETRKSPANAKFTCDYCQKRYSQKVTLRVHIQHEHLNYRSHECEWCDKKFYCKSRLRAHIVKHTKERNFTCSLCGGKFVTKESLLYHTRTHTGERPHACPLCDARFLSRSRRAAHLRARHRAAHCLPKPRQLHSRDKLTARADTANELHALSDDTHGQIHSHSKEYIVMYQTEPRVECAEKRHIDENVQYGSECDMKYEYRVSGADGGAGDDNGAVYLEVPDGDEFVKVSEIVEV